MSTHSISTMSHVEDRTDAGRARAGISVRRVCSAGVTAAVTGSAVLYGYGAAARALSVPMHAGDPGASTAQPLSPLNFSVGVVFCTIFGTVLVALLCRYASRPRGTFLRAAGALVAVSLVFPIAASHTEAATRVCLALAHLVAAAIVVPQLARALRH